MNQAQETGSSQGAFLEHLLQEQLKQQLPGDRSGNGNVNSINDMNMDENGSVSIGRSSANASFSSGNNGSTSTMPSISNSMGIGINQQQKYQQNRMMSFLQERQQQHFIANSIVGGSSDLQSNIGFSGLSTSVGLDSRLGGTGIGSGISSNAWIDGLGGVGLGTGAVASASGSFYQTEQDLLLSSQRYTSMGGHIGGNLLASNGGSDGSFGDTSLSSLMGGMPQLSLPHQPHNPDQTSLNKHQKTNRKNFTDVLFAKQAQAAFLRAAQAQLPRTIRLPCNARGMKADHNSSTAYFDVPENARHGQHLLCSHSVCRAAGVKFRYCFYCKKPVTKQNFRSRHLHADLNPNYRKKDGKDTNKKKENGKSKIDTKRNMKTEISKSAHNELNSIDTSEEKLKKPQANGDVRDSLERVSAFPLNSMKKESSRDEIEQCFERPSKLPKLSNSDGENIGENKKA